MCLGEQPRMRFPRGLWINLLLFWLQLQAVWCEPFEKAPWKTFVWLPTGPPEFRSQVAKWLGVDVEAASAPVDWDGRELRLTRQGQKLSTTAYRTFEAGPGNYRIQFAAKGGGTISVGCGPTKKRCELGEDWQDFELAVRLPFASDDISLSVGASGQQDVTLRNFTLQLVPDLQSATEEPQKPQFTLVEPSYRRTGFAGHPSTVRLHLPQASPFRLRLQLQGETLWQTQGDLAAGQHEFSHALPSLPQDLPSAIGECRWELELDGLDLEQHFQLCSGGPPRIDISAGKLRQDQQPLFLVGNYIRQDNLQEAQELGLNLAVVHQGQLKSQAQQAMWLIPELTLTASDPQWPAGLEQQVASPDKRVLAWYAIDEPDTDNARLQIARQAYQLLREKDPDRPVFTTCHRTDGYCEVANVTDILAIDPYPIKPVSTPLWMLGQNVERACEAAGPGRCVMLVNQAFGLFPYWPKLPTAAEERAMAFEAIMHGARGIIYYAQEEILWPEPPDYKFRQKNSRLWPALQALTSELKGLSPMFLGKAEPGPLTDSVDATIWTYGERRFVTLINLVHRPSSYPLDSLNSEQLAEIVGGDLHNPRPLSIRQALVLQPLEARVLELKGASAVRHHH